MLSPEENGIPWPDIVLSFRNLADSVPEIQSMAQLVQEMFDSDFPSAGLHGCTSMSDLIVGPSRDIFGNPYLRIHYDRNNQEFHFVFEDGTLQPWKRVCQEAEAFDVLIRFMTKRARWFCLR